MRAIQHRIISVLTLLALCLLLQGSAGCTRSQRETTLHATLVSVNAARDGFSSWDREHALAIVDAAKTREQATTEVSAYREWRQQITASFEVAYRLLAVAATQTDKPSLDAAVAHAGALVEAIEKLISIKTEGK